LNYTWQRTRETLTHLAKNSVGSPHDGILLEYTNPYTGGPALPTIGCYIQLLTPGQHTTAHQHTGSAIYHVAQGAGYSVVSGMRIDWSEKDVCAVPSWAMHEHVNTGPGDAILFSATDLPVIRSLGLYRERELTTGGGHQEITQVFQR
jgi:gentisate 1,2-dioxygenase